MRKILKGNSDFVLGVVSLVLSLLLLRETKNIVSDGALMPRFFLVVMITLSVMLIAQSIIKNLKGKDSTTKVTFSDLMMGVFLPGGIMIGASFLLDILGFYVITFLLVLAFFTLQTYALHKTVKISKRELIRNITFAAMLTGAMYVAFALLLKLTTPVGIFGF